MLILTPLLDGTIASRVREHHWFIAPLTPLLPRYIHLSDDTIGQIDMTTGAPKRRR